MKKININSSGDEIELYSDVCHIIEGSRQRLATTINEEICMLHWQIGKRIKEDVLYSQRADYGKQIVKILSEKLTAQYGKGWGFEKLKHCVRSAYLFTEEEIGYALRTQLTWTQLPDKNLLSQKLHKAIAVAREHYQSNEMEKK